MLADGEPLPFASDLDQVMQDAHNRDAVALLIDLPTPHGPAVHIDVVLSQDLVTEIDCATTDRSHFFNEAAKDRLQRQRMEDDGRADRYSGADLIQPPHA